MNPFENMMAPPTRLPEDPAVARLAAGEDPATVAAELPTSSAAWATLAEAALARSGPAVGPDHQQAVRAAVLAYAYARTGYHRGLDALRRAGWKGQGPVPWAHEPNHGFLRALHALGRAAAVIGEQDEAARCDQLLADSDPEAAAQLGG